MRKRVAKLTEYEVVRSEDLSEWSRAHRVHGSWLQVDKNGSRHVLPASCLVVVDIDSLQLEVGVTMVGASWVDAVLVGNNLPEL